MSLRSEQKEKTRQAIINAALLLSEEKGFPALSLREVTREAEIAPATFYRHFKDMEELGLVLVDKVAQTLVFLENYWLLIDKSSTLNPTYLPLFY